MGRAAFGSFSEALRGVRWRETPGGILFIGEYRPAVYSIVYGCPLVN